jgi:hypothetical protein
MTSDLDSSAKAGEPESIKKNVRKIALRVDGK